MTAYIMIHGGNKYTPGLCNSAGWLYGVQWPSTAYAPVYMTDYTRPDDDRESWRRYVAYLRGTLPWLALVIDYEQPDQTALMLERVAEVYDLGIVPVVAAKFPGAVEAIPREARVGVSVATSHMNAGYMPPRSEFDGHHQVHLLGGHPDQWLHLVREYDGAASVESADGNVLYRQARWGKMWRDGGYVEHRRRAERLPTMWLAVESMRNAAAYVERSETLHRLDSPRIGVLLEQMGYAPRQMALPL